MGNAAFRAYLPRVDEATTAAVVHQAPTATHGTETILLVEDDPAVAHLVQRVLALRGYTVLAAGKPSEAEAIFSQHSRPPELLLTDVVMPECDGKELFLRLQARRPDLKVLYMSGYTVNAIAHHGVLDAGTAFLQKPFTPEALGKKVREVLDAPPSGAAEPSGPET
jgi:DNA-binding NtrC family response regulator